MNGMSSLMLQKIHYPQNYWFRYNSYRQIFQSLEVNRRKKRAFYVTRKPHISPP